MKKIGDYYYAKVDVKQCGSFMVMSEIDMADDDILGGCIDNDLLETDDVPFADIDTLIDDYDLRAFASCTFEI